jgi:hypothetical protein
LSESTSSNGLLIVGNDVFEVFCFSKKLHMPGKRVSSAMCIEIYFYAILFYLFCVCTSCNLSFNLFPVGSHVVEHFEVH